jgi:hypothetical protein
VVVLTAGPAGSGELRVKKYVATHAPINITAPTPRPTFIPLEIVCLLDSFLDPLIVAIPSPLVRSDSAAQPIRLHHARPAAPEAKTPQFGLTRAGVFWKKAMIFSKDYVGYLARQTVKHLVDAKMIETTKPAVLNERVTAAMIEELALEDRINEEVRVILDAFQEDMRKTGASYPEMFKKVKNELARKYKAVL